MPKPNIGDYPEYFGRYINLVPEENILDSFKNQDEKISEFLKAIDEKKSGFAYAPGKWTLKELLQHSIDTERIFTYRALCIARREPASLPSFDENLYADNTNANARSWQNLSEEFINLRRSTKDLFGSFTDEMLQVKGTIGNNPMSVKSLGFIILGHITHHINVAKEKYLRI